VPSPLNTLNAKSLSEKVSFSSFLMIGLTNTQHFNIPFCSKFSSLSNTSRPFLIILPVRGATTATTGDHFWKPGKRAVFPKSQGKPRKSGKVLRKAH